MANKVYQEMSAEQHELVDFRIAERIKELDISVFGHDKNTLEYKVRAYERLCNEIQGCLSSIDLSRSMAALYRKMSDIDKTEVKN